MPGYLVPQISSASSIGFTPSGNLSASTIQEALQELDTEKLVTNDWAGKSGPASWSSAYKNLWQSGAGSGKSINHSLYNYGLLINQTGYYEVIAGQRSAGGDCFIGIGVDGNRTTLDTRSTGIWSHDHASSSAAWTHSYYIGLLNANEIITAGGAAATNLTFAGLGYAGFLTIKRIG
jgi:hypothetical protein